MIPYLQDDIITKLKVRRNRWYEEDGCPKYVVIPGSQSIPSLFGSPSLPIVIVEAELDGMLLYQEAGDICAVLSIGGSANFPDSATHALLKKSPLILFALDFDEAGKRLFNDGVLPIQNCELGLLPMQKALEMHSCLGQIYGHGL